MTTLKNEAKMALTLRSGHHATVYEVRRDPTLTNKDIIRDKSKPVFPFVGGSKYKGQWSDDKKEGFGIQINPDETKYEGEWRDNKYHGRGTLWIKKNKSYLRLYVGEWVEGRMEGQGVYYYPKNEIYRGDWSNGKKSGNGKYEYENGDIYEGEWMDDLNHGFGSMNYSNGNIYEGTWARGKKEGPGMYFYASTRKIYQGEWLDDQAKCGEFRPLNRSEQIRFSKTHGKDIFKNDFSMPELRLADSQQVVDMAVSNVRLSSLENQFSPRNSPRDDYFTSAQMSRARKCFNELCHNVDNVIAIPLQKLGVVLKEFDLNIDHQVLIDIEQQFSERSTQELTFSDVIEIAHFLVNDNS